MYFSFRGTKTPGVQRTIKTMQAHFTTVVYLWIVIIQIGSNIGYIPGGFRRLRCNPDMFHARPPLFCQALSHLRRENETQVYLPKAELFGCGLNGSPFVAYTNQKGRFLQPVSEAKGQFGNPARAVSGEAHTSPIKTLTGRTVPRPRPKYIVRTKPGLPFTPKACGKAQDRLELWQSVHPRRKIGF